MFEHFILCECCLLLTNIKHTICYTVTKKVKLNEAIKKRICYLGFVTNYIISLTIVHLIFHHFRFCLMTFKLDVKRSISEQS